MKLPDKLVSQFAKMLKPETSKKETTLYGTIVADSESKFVKLDGSDMMTPISTTVDMLEGERVTVLLKNHTAIVTGNISSPAARVGVVSAMADTVRTVEQRTRYATIIDLIYPIGSIYLSVNAANPEMLFGGKWERISDAFLYGAGTYAVGSTGGEANHTLTVDEMPSHEGHLYSNSGIPFGHGSATGKYLSPTALSDYGNTGRGWNSISNEMYPAGFSRGGSEPHNNMPPYLVVNIWKRIE